MAKFRITSKVSTLGEAKRLLLTKRAELAQANKAKRIENEATSAVATISKPAISPLATAKAAPVAKPVVLDVHDYLALRMKQISGVWMNKSELASLSVADDATDVVEAAIETLSKTDQYHEGILLINAHTALQRNELTKDLDPRDILAEIKSSKAIALKSEREKRAFATWYTPSK